MPSRRTLLLGGGLAGSAVLGAVATDRLWHSGTVKRKRISVSWEQGGVEGSGHLLQTVLAPDGEVDLQYAPAYVEAAVEGARAVSVDGSLHEDLATEFGSVAYTVGVCGTAPGENCAYGMRRVGREGFNRLQVGDVGTVSVAGDRLFVHGVEERSDWSGRSDVGTFEFER